MSKSWDNIEKAYQALYDEYEDTLKKYKKVCKTSKIVLAKRLSALQSEKAGFDWVEEQAPVDLFRFEDYAYQTIDILPTKVDMHERWVCIKEYWDDNEDKIKSTDVECSLYGCCNLPFINYLIDQMEKDIEKRSMKGIVAHICSKI